MPTNFTAIPGATGETFQPETLSYTKVYRRKATSTVGMLSATGYSNELQITVTTSWFTPVYDSESGSLIEVEDDILIIDDPDYDGGTIISAQTINTGETPTELVEDVAPTKLGNPFTPVSYHWWVSKFSNQAVLKYVFGATGATYQPPVLYSNTWYSRRSVDSGGQMGSTPFIKITVMDGANQVYEYGVLNPGSITGDTTTIYTGATPTILYNVVSAYNASGVTVNNDPISYNWQFSWDNLAWQSAGVSTENYQPDALSYSTWFKRVATQSTYLVANSNVVKVTVLDGNDDEVLYDGF